MRKKTEILKALNEPNRIRILMMLLKKPLCVCEITSILKLNTSTVSNHLSSLRNAGFIEDEKDGKWINYRIIKNPENQMVRDILKLIPDWFSTDETIKNDLQQIHQVDRYQITMNIPKAEEVLI